MLPNGMAVQLPPTNRRNVKDLLPEKIIVYWFSTKISVRFYQIGWLFSCHLLTGRNVKDLSPEKVTSYCLSKKNSVSLYQIG